MEETNCPTRDEGDTDRTKGLKDEERTCSGQESKNKRGLDKTSWGGNEYKLGQKKNFREHAFLRKRRNSGLLF